MATHFETVLERSRFSDDAFSNSKSVVLVASSRPQSTSTSISDYKAIDIYENIPEQINSDDLYSFIDSFDFINSDLANTLIVTGELEELLNELLEVDTQTITFQNYTENNMELLAAKCSQGLVDQDVLPYSKNLGIRPEKRSYQSDYFTSEKESDVSVRQSCLSNFKCPKYSVNGSNLDNGEKREWEQNDNAEMCRKCGPFEINFGTEGYDLTDFN